MRFLFLIMLLGNEGAEYDRLKIFVVKVSFFLKVASTNENLMINQFSCQFSLSYHMLYMQPS